MGGFNLPPGCTYQQLEESMGVEAPCECCGQMEDKCKCPECLACGEIGNPKCYEEANFRQCKEGCRVEPLRYSRLQLAGQVHLLIAQVDLIFDDEQRFLQEAVEIDDKENDFYVDDETFNKGIESFLGRLKKFLNQ